MTTTLATTKAVGHTSVRECNMRSRDPMETDDGIDEDAKRKFHEDAERTTFARGYAAGQREAWQAWEERGKGKEGTDKAKGDEDAALYAAAASAYGKDAK